MEYRLLEKTELWVSPVDLDGADLSACSRAVASALQLEPEQVLVTDAMEHRLTFDILVPTIRAEQILGRERLLLDALGQVRGVTLREGTSVHSEGILGLIGMDEETGREMAERSREMGRQIIERIQKRAMVIATGKEVIARQIQDTNTPFLIESLLSDAYDAVAGPVLEDRAETIYMGLRRAVEDAFGLIVTTGGIGAEGKDQTLEALVRLDPDASTPYVLKFQKGAGRHYKDGVRIGVGRYGQATIVCLPGPNEEVRLLWPVLREGLRQDLEKEALAFRLAEKLREKFLNRSGHSTEHISHGR
jgi:hypothetical protein